MGSISENFQKMIREEREEARKEERIKTEQARKEAEAAKKEAESVKAKLEAGIREMVLDNLEKNKSSANAVSQLQRFFALSKKEAKEYTLKYGYKSA